MLKLGLNEIISNTEARKKLYQFFANLFNQQPTLQLSRDFYDFLSQECAFSEEDNPRLKEGIHLLCQFADQLEIYDTDELTTTLRVEWLRLFRGIKPDYGLPPARASAYGFYEIQKLLECYAKVGLKIAHPYFEPDYAGIQLAFLNKLVNLELAHWNANEQHKALQIISQEKIFLEEHLRWISDLCQRGIDEAETLFYKGVLIFLNAFIESEHHWLNQYNETHCSLG